LLPNSDDETLEFAALIHVNGQLNGAVNLGAYYLTLNIGSLGGRCMISA